MIKVFFLKENIEESYGGWQLEDGNEFHGDKLLNFRDGNINDKEFFNFIHDVKVSHETIIDHIP